MHILHVEESFIPNLGYQINLLTKFMALKGHKITILTTNLDMIVENQKVYVPDNIQELDKELYDKYGIKIIRVKVKRIISNRCQWESSVFDRICDINPDIIYLHNNDSLIAIQYFLFYLRKIKIPIVSDSHMLDVASRNRFAKVFRWFYRKFVTPIIIKNEVPILRVVDDRFIQYAYNIPTELSPLMSFGSDIENFYSNELSRKKTRVELEINDDDFVVLYAGKLSEDKDAQFLAKSIEAEFPSSKRKIIFIIIGNTHGEYGQSVENIFNKSKNRIIRLPLQKYKDLPKYFRCADLGLIHSAASLTFYDMQACGLPILWSNIDVNVARTKNKNGMVFEIKNLLDLREKINIFANMDSSEYDEYSLNSQRYIRENYSYDSVTDMYLDVIEKEFQKRKNMNIIYK